MFIVAKSVRRLRAVDYGFSLKMYRLLASATKRINEFILRTVSLIKRKEWRSLNRTLGTPSRIEAQSDK